MKQITCAALFFMLLCLPKIASSQSISEIKITASFNGQSLKSIFKAIEKDYPIHFYYQESEYLDKPVSISFQEETLSSVLNQLLKDNPLGYFFYRDYAVMIMPEALIGEAYSANYYQALEENINTDEKDTRASRKQITIGDIAKLSPSGKAKINGLVIGSRKKPVIGATVFWEDLGEGTATDENGKFESILPIGKHELSIQYIGYQDYKKEVTVLSDGDLEVKLRIEAVNLDEVTVEAARPDDNVGNAQIGVTRLDIKNIKKLPTFMGEADVVKSLLMQPGVSTIGEGATGFNVRGGEVDQNLVMQDEGFIFNSSHALGFFSTFNTDLISKVELYKGNIPAQFGGRLASVLDVEMKQGSFENFKMKGGLGLISTRVSLETPVVKKKSALVLGFRSTYSDWILNQIKVREVQNSSAFFYDANLRYTQKLDKKGKNTLILSGYASSDEFTFNQEFGFEYSTVLGQIILKNIISNKTFSKFSFVVSEYKSTTKDLAGFDGARLDNGLSYLKIKEQITFTPQKELQFIAGLSSILYKVDPGKSTPFGVLSQVISEEIEDEKGLESAVFLNAEWTFSPALTLTGGLRVGLFNFLGEKTIFEYENADFPTAVSITNSSLQTGLIKNYASIEPRISGRYRLDEFSSIKAGYSRTAQYINQISNTDTPTPTNQWQLSTAYIRPQRSHNFSVGFFKNFEDNNWETSAETFVRLVDKINDYKDFADLTLNEHLETELLRGKGRAYGLELAIRKKRGVFHGALAYTLSRTERQVAGINSNNWYRSNFDKPHDLSFLFNYQPNQRHTVTLNFSYSTGRPTTPPIGSYEAPNGLIIPLYANRNEGRIPDYHRLDFAYTVGRGYKVDKKFRTSWTFSVYNVYGRKNAFSVFFTQTPYESVTANRLAILGAAFPAITFNIETN